MWIRRAACRFKVAQGRRRLLGVRAKGSLRQGGPPEVVPAGIVSFGHSLIFVRTSRTQLHSHFSGHGSRHPSLMQCCGQLSPGSPFFERIGRSDRERNRFTSTARDVPHPEIIWVNMNSPPAKSSKCAWYPPGCSVGSFKNACRFDHSWPQHGHALNGVVFIT